MGHRLVNRSNETLRAGIDARRLGSLAGAVCTALLAAACGGPGIGPMPEGPTWSLADKKPASLGGTASTAQVPPPAPVPNYEYRGGRDPVTGKSELAEGAPPLVQQSVATGEGGAPRVIQIRKGDTLHGLSLAHHVSVKALMAANNLKSTTIIPGKKLVIPAG